MPYLGALFSSSYCCALSRTTDYYSTGKIVVAPENHCGSGTKWTAKREEPNKPQFRGFCRSAWAIGLTDVFGSVSSVQGKFGVGRTANRSVQGKWRNRGLRFRYDRFGVRLSTEVSSLLAFLNHLPAETSTVLIQIEWRSHAHTKQASKSNQYPASY
jgi:hypothetical protein